MDTVSTGAGRAGMNQAGMNKASFNQASFNQASFTQATLKEIVMQSFKLMLNAVLLSLLLMGSALAADKVNINTADVATLDQVLVNVGPSKAQAIVDYRKAHGAFKSPEQLALVKGIGLKTVEKNRDRIVVGGMASAKKTSAAGKTAAPKSKAIANR